MFTSCSSSVGKSTHASSKPSEPGSKRPVWLPVAAIRKLRQMQWLHQTALPNPSVKASPNSCACKARHGHVYHRPCRALHTPL